MITWNCKLVVVLVAVVVLVTPVVVVVVVLVFTVIIGKRGNDAESTMPLCKKSILKTSVLTQRTINRR